jgi:hypothetical protein
MHEVRPASAIVFGASYAPSRSGKHQTIPLSSTIAKVITAGLMTNLRQKCEVMHLSFNVTLIRIPGPVHAPLIKVFLGLALDT